MEPNTEDEYLVIDGSEEEGGGQMFRMSIALSQILSKPVEVTKIRANRKPPGLKEQHLTGLKAMIDLTHAEADGAVMKSSTVKYNSKGIVENHNVKAECTGAGSMNLILQVVLPAILFAKNDPGEEQYTINMKGGSIGAWAPTYLSIHNVLKPLLQQFGVEFDYRLVKHGFYPDVRGACVLTAKPAILPLKAVDLTKRGKINKIELHSVYCPEIMRSTFEKYVSEALIPKLEEEIKENDQIIEKTVTSYVEWVEISNPKARACSISWVCTVTFEYGAILYQDLLVDAGKQLKNLKTGKISTLCLDKEFETFTEKILTLINHQEIWVDEHHADQLLLFMALAEGTSKIRTIKPISGHINGMIRILNQFIPDLYIEINELEDSTDIEVQGIGLKR